VIPPELVLFDCDGVLVDSETIANRVMAEDLTRRGYPVNTEQAMDLFVGGTLASAKDYVTGQGMSLPDTWLDDVYAAMYATLANEVEVVPHVAGVLDRLDASGVPYAVVSNGSETRMGITLGRTGLLDRFEGRIFSAHTVGIAKPDPGLFLHAASAFGVTPGAAIVVEDSRTGAKAARLAGMRCFGYAADTHPDKLRSEGAVVFADMRELPELLLAGSDWRPNQAR